MGLGYLLTRRWTPEWRPPATRHTTTPRRIQSLAVLPLENLSRDREREAFADGMTDALINDLAQVSALRVISRTSAMRFKGARASVIDIARQLAVDAVVEGSVLWDADERDRSAAGVGARHR
jgi:TolB-like protein